MDYAPTHAIYEERDGSWAVCPDGGICGDAEYNTLTEALAHVRVDCECDVPTDGGVYVAHVEVYRYRPSGHPVKITAGCELPPHPWRKLPEPPRPDGV